VTNNASWPPGIDACTASDALDAIDGAPIVRGIRSLWEGASVAGPVITIRLAEGTPPPDRPPLHLGATAIGQSQPGDVIVVDNGGRTEMGGWGGLLSRAAHARGVAGVVVDGACRDIDEARALRFPVFGLGSVARTARGRVHEVACGEPVQIGGVTVRTGDWVVADGSGVIFIPAHLVGAVRDLAAGLAAREAQMVKLIQDGAALEQIFGPGYEHMIAEAGPARPPGRTSTTNPED
jgi:4-hydroxy-4-methyl-2-oxoglutarate aldolase